MYKGYHERIFVCEPWQPRRAKGLAPLPPTNIHPVSSELFKPFCSSPAQYLFLRSITTSSSPAPNFSICWPSQPFSAGAHASIKRMPAAYEIRAGGDVKNRKQSIADLKLRRLNELNLRLREDLERPRIKVSEASTSYVMSPPFATACNRDVAKLISIAF